MCAHPWYGVNAQCMVAIVGFDEEVELQITEVTIVIKNQK